METAMSSQIARFPLRAAACGLLLALLCAPVASADPGKTAVSPEERFAALDTDKDGKVTREEFFAAYPQMKEGAFQAIDTDKDGHISLEEWKAFSSGHSSDMRNSAMGSGMGGGKMGSMPPQGAGGGNATGKAPMPELIMPPRGK
jgi:hypothetical protein